MLILATIRAQRCFDLAAQGQDDDALALVQQTLASLYGRRCLPLKTELTFLQSFLLLGAQNKEGLSTLRTALRQTRSGSGHNPDEASLLIRYGLHLLWNARFSSPSSCLVDLIAKQTFDESKIRSILLGRFPVPAPYQRHK